MNPSTQKVPKLSEDLAAGLIQCTPVHMVYLLTVAEIGPHYWDHLRSFNPDLPPLDQIATLYAGCVLGIAYVGAGYQQPDTPTFSTEIYRRLAARYNLPIDMLMDLSEDFEKGTDIPELITRLRAAGL